MEKEFVAKASIVIDASAARVWEALTDAKKIKQYMFDTNVVSEWRVGSPITWKGEWQGRSYEDKGFVLKIERERLLSYSHFSPLLGKPDVPENYHTVTVELAGDGKRTTVSLRQDNNATKEARAHSENNWQMMLLTLKQFLEK